MRLSAWFALLVITVVRAVPPPDPAAWMFSPSVVVDVDLVIPPSSMALIPTDMSAERPYVPATFTMTHAVGGVVERTYGPWAVTLKVKGMYGSFRSLPGGEKAAFKIKFPSGRRPDGLKKFTLNNMVQDPSMVREVLAYEVFRAMDVAAPRAGYARVTVNGTYMGSYLNLETMDDRALPLRYDGTLHLYEGSYGSWWGDVADPFSGHYEVDEGDEADRSDLYALIAAARGPRKGWFARMHPVADLEQMTRMWACEWFTGHWDGYSQFITNNYYLHSGPDGRFTMMPWGADQTFTWADRFNDSPDHFIFNGCVKDPIGRALYTDALQAVAARWESLNLPALADLAHASVAAESAGIDDVKWFIQARLQEHRDWAASLPPPPAGVTVMTKSLRGNGRADFSWVLPAKPRRQPRDAEIQAYAVEYRLVGAPWLRVAASLGRAHCRIEKLASGTYEYRVRHTNRIGDSLPATGTFTIP